MDSLRGHLLVAAPTLADPNFKRSVVLIIQHDEGGAFGLVLNHTTESTVGEIWEMVADGPCDSSVLVNLGGPVRGPLLALHTRAACSEGEVVPGVHIATNRGHLDQLVRESLGSVRIFSGYSGWAAGQLEGELEAGGWMILAASDELVFAEQDTMWKRAAQIIGEQVIKPILKKAQRPPEPSSN